MKRRDTKRQTPGKEESVIGIAKKPEAQHSEEASRTPSKLPPRPSDVDAASADSVAAGHITPPPANDAGVPRSAGSGHPAEPSTPNNKPSNATDAATDKPAGKISFSLPSQTSQKPSSPQAKSPLGKSRWDSARPDFESRMALPDKSKAMVGRGKAGERQRGEEHTLDSRPQKYNQRKSSAERPGRGGRGGYRYPPPGPGRSIRQW